MPTTAHDVSVLFIELGLAVIGLALIARLASRWGFSAIPLYLLAGLAFGNGGLAPLSLSRNFIHIGAEIGILLLLFMLGVESSPEQVGQNLRNKREVNSSRVTMNGLTWPKIEQLRQ
jgi:monovalent cation:H+ antiporter-2, CPA2 family